MVLIPKWNFPFAIKTDHYPVCSVNRLLNYLLLFRICWNFFSALINEQ